MLRGNMVNTPTNTPTNTLYSSMRAAPTKGAALPRAGGRGAQVQI